MPARQLGDTLGGTVFAFLSDQDELFSRAWRVLSSLPQTELMRVAPSAQLQRTEPGSVAALGLRSATLIVAFDDD